jgi:hypothetical protein
MGSPTPPCREAAPSAAKRLGVTGGACCHPRRPEAPRILRPATSGRDSVSACGGPACSCHSTCGSPTRGCHSTCDGPICSGRSTCRRSICSGLTRGCHLVCGGPTCSGHSAYRHSTCSDSARGWCYACGGSGRGFISGRSDPARSCHSTCHDPGRGDSGCRSTTCGRRTRRPGFATHTHSAEARRCRTRARSRGFGPSVARCPTVSTSRPGRKARRATPGPAQSRWIIIK